jgi:hypothetical protein
MLPELANGNNEGSSLAGINDTGQGKGIDELWLCAGV